MPVQKLTHFLNFTFSAPDKWPEISRKFARIQILIEKMKETVQCMHIRTWGEICQKVTQRKASRTFPAKRWIKKDPFEGQDEDNSSSYFKCKNSCSLKNFLQWNEMLVLADFFLFRREVKRVYFFLETPTVRPRRPVVLVCWPRTRRSQWWRRPRWHRI